MELDIIKKNLQLNYYKNLLKTLKKSSIEHKFLHDLINGINNEKEKLTLSITETDTENNEELVYSEDYLYKKSWTKLSEVHKII